ncbi:protein kinase domain-containing protein [Nocardiopsis sp. LOL_012]|uniref:serine/threonine-protein kinase n=1 Tax=Nocardiopsis sp. LOL_012 TaxID=3345409 RepID=UPI003A85318A
MTGERVLGGRYRLHTLVGRGGMGEVWRAVDGVLDRDVAVKVIRPGSVGTAEVVSRFRREARLTARLAGHPHVVILHDFGNDGPEGDEVLYAVMELVQGRPLTAVLRESGPMPVPRAVDLVSQAASGLGAAHRAGIVHRDVKPSNLMVVEEGPGGGTVKVLDFGIASLTAAETSRRLTRTGGVMGTPAYMSPEQINGTRMSAAGDLYSLGAILYELLTGRPPFESPHPLAVLRMHMVERPRPAEELRPDVPRPLSELVASMLAKAPQDRPAFAEEVLDGLAPFLPRGRPRTRPEAGRAREERPGSADGADAAEPTTRLDADALRDRLEAALALADGGRYAAAVREVGGLLPLLTGALGADHPDTLRARRQEAYLSGKDGDHRGAVARLDALVADLMRVYGAQHPETLAARYYLAANAGQAGDHALAARVHADLVPDLVAVHGPDAERVLGTRLYLAFATGEAGRPRQAVDLLEGLVPDLARVLGEEDRTTLRGRHYHAAYLGHSGAPEEAVHRYRALVEDHTRIFGAAHPATRIARSHLERWEARLRP